MQRTVLRTVEVGRRKEILLIALLTLVGSSLLGCTQTKQRQENLANGQISQKRALEYKGWKIQLLGVETSKRQLTINDFVIGIGSPKAPKAETEYVKPKGVFLLVTLSVEKVDGETLQLAKSLVIDDQGQQFPTLAVGAKGTREDFIFFKGGGPENSGSCQLAFDVPLESTNFKLRPMGESPEIDLAEAAQKQND